MSKLIIKNIKLLVAAAHTFPEKVAGKAMQDLPVVENAWLLIEDGIIAGFGPMEKIPSTENAEIMDASDRFVLPTWCDSHTHLVFPQSREVEYTDKIKGLSYEEIAKRGGGILNSAKNMQEADENQLFADAMQRLQEIVRWGTGAVEIKSGYGLTTATELKMLRVIKRLKAESPVTIRSTFLGAHAVPTEFKGNPDKYVDLVINEMLPAVAAEQLADFVDVFCDRGFFSIGQTSKILEAAAKYDLKPKIHANELDFSGGIQTGIKHKALSVDHLEYTGEEEINALLESDTMPVILPGAAFFLNLKYAPARKIIDAGLPLTLATDFNPGSSPSGNMQLIISMGSILYKMLPRETINAVTINGAYAMGLQKELGSITPGKKANLIITKPIPSIEYIPYAYGENKVEKTILNGIVQ
ncbi:imidazolonepropionase [Marinilabilia sp.]|uniref:imidazolonepropionase n=1 Tax=Marinilabilia sp. TaxID=2021252 RepID=UPI0025C5CA12|nr:imidazolonepropionase [Marinilabilia sp.]